MSTEVTVVSLPACDIHRGEHPAQYDGKTTMGPWANMCQQAFDEYGVGLGTGKGQKFVLAGAGVQ